MTGAGSGIGLTTALEYVDRGTRINAICPGTSDTPMVAQAVADAPKHMDTLVNEIPAGRLGRPRRSPPRSCGCAAPAPAS